MLLVLGVPQALIACRQLAANGIFHRYLCANLESTVRHDSELIYVLLANRDAQLEAYLRRAELGSIFALGWLLTWFAHSIDDYDRVVRIYDFFLASHRLMPVYLSAAIVLDRRYDIVERCECDMVSIHSLLTRLSVDIQIETLIADAFELYSRYPPTELEGDLCIEYERMGEYG